MKEQAEETPILPGNSSNSQTSQNEEVGDDKSSIWAVTFNYINTIIGSGIIGMPYAMKLCGPGLGALGLFISAVATDYSLINTIKAGEMSGTDTFQDMVKFCYGNIGYVLITIFQFLFPFFAMAGYNVIVGDTITKVFIFAVGLDGTSIFAQREFILFLTTIFITLPLSCNRNVNRLVKVSTVGIAFIFLVMLCLFIRVPMTGNIPNLFEGQELFMFSGLPSAFGIMAHAYMCGHIAYPLYRSIEDTSLKRWRHTTHMSLGTSFLVMLTFAMAGYFTFGRYTQGDLMNNYCWDDLLMNISRVVFSFTVVLTYPLEAFAAREVVLTAIFGTPDLFRDMSTKMAWFIHLSITVILVASTFALSISTNCLAAFLEIDGLVTAVPISCIFPNICFLKLTDGPMYSREKLPALIVTFFGACTVAAGIMNIAMNGLDKCLKDKPMFYCEGYFGDSAMINDTMKI